MIQKWLKKADQQKDEITEKQVELKNLDQIKILVDRFYGKIRKDDLLAKIFDDVIGDRWNEHLPKMYSFWQTVLTEDRTYQGRPLLPHLNLPVEEKHFNRWVYLWEETLDEMYYGTAVEAAKWQANRMAQMFQLKINFIKEQQGLNP